ncbi:hypothetical protein ACFU99_35000 [Streptomyces sp. NPDC057654]|uniref:hypothetical protein n=1 Tax=Streptomyces sp. NPDC057654 TaxID=3346196 RepID=UPI0036744DEA
MTASFSAADLRHTVAILSSPSVIRLITEIDDNGPIAPRGLARTLADLSPHRLRQATGAARALGLIHGRPADGLCLTVAGAELADVYDATARWARRHAYPRAAADFTSRIQHTFRLLEQTLAPNAADDRGPAHARLPGTRADADPAGPRELLRQWLSTYAARPAA